MTTRSFDALPELDLLSITAPPKLHLFDLPPPMLVSVIESLLFEEEIVGFVDFIMLSSARGQYLWRTQIRRMLRCPDMDYHKYLSLTPTSPPAFPHTHLTS